VALKKTSESPSIADTVLFDLPCPDASGCFPANPYKVNRVVIFFVERDFSGPGVTEFESRVANPAADAAAEHAEAVACASPTPENVREAKRARAAADSAASVSPIFYNEARPVATFGTDDFPAWLSTDTGNAILTPDEFDENGNAQSGHFNLEWSPVGMREGDYFLCWTWTPNPAGDSLANFQQFYLQGATQLTTSLPTHQTDPEKYETLLERYLPEMFKFTLADNDLTPEVLQSYHKAVARQFTDVENQANQVSDLLDANATHEAFLPLLGNMLNVKLKSEDPTLWRRQIKQAVPLYKKKGTLNGLKEALASAGVTLTKVTRLWQVVSRYTWQESFVVSADPETEFALAKVAVLSDPNFELYHRASGSDDYTPLTTDYVDFATSGGVTTVTWLGDVNPTPISLAGGDVVRVVYPVVAVPNPTEQTIENYVRTLPLMDLRDELAQKYPPKNWNVRLIEEDDPLFAVVIPSRHPYHDPIIWGKVRTEFPYSENAYNMDEYNGSTRDSISPCDIGKEFVDSCSYGQSSKITVDVEIENLSDHRITEATDVIREMIPFHAQVQALNFAGGYTDLVQPPVETIECLITMQGQETVVSGSAQLYFNRAMRRGLTTEEITRTMLASSVVAATDTGTGANVAVAVFSGTVRFDRIGLDPTTGTLEILSPSAYAGRYSLANPLKNTAELASVVAEPVAATPFTFRVDNLVESFPSGCSVAPAHKRVLLDPAKDFGETGVQSQWDVDHGTATGAWVVTISGINHAVLNVMPDGGLLLDDPSNVLPLVTTTGVSYVLKNASLTVIDSGSGATLNVEARGVVTLPLTPPIDVRDIAEVGFYARLNGTGPQYVVIGHIDGSLTKFLILGWTGASASGIRVDVYHRLADGQTGNLAYKGMTVTLGTQNETSLGVLNGANAGTLYTEDDIVENDHFKENFLVEINGDMYVMADIDGSLVTLAGGPVVDWKTTGTPVSVVLHRFNKTSFTASGQEFNNYDRRGDDIIVAETDTASFPLMYRAHALNKAKQNQVEDEVGQEETISFEIEYQDGTTEQGEI
jgi:hypothetical protein